jgi:hypothetical protein
LPLGYRAKFLLKTASIACGVLLLLATVNFCLESWPPAKNSFDPLPSTGGVIDVRILDSGWSGYKSYLYQINVNEGRILELENKSISPQEFEIPPWRALPGGDTDTGRSHNFSEVTGSSHNFPGFSSPDGRYVVISSGDDGNQSHGAGPIPIFVELSSDHTEVFQTSIPYRYYVGGVTWSPDSKAVALLLCSQRFGFGPLDLLSAFAGHPIQYKSFGFLIVNVEERRSVAVMRFTGRYALGWAALEWEPLHK